MPEDLSNGYCSRCGQSATACYLESRFVVLDLLQDIDDLRLGNLADQVAYDLLETITAQQNETIKALGKEIERLRALVPQGVVN